MANADRLPTRSRLVTWGLQVPSTCSLCTTNEETRDHLLFRCAYSREVWNLTIARLSYPSRLTSWSELLSWIRHSSNAAPSILKKLVVHSTIYNLWGQKASSTAKVCFRMLLSTTSSTRKRGTQSQLGSIGSNFEI